MQCCPIWTTQWSCRQSIVVLGRQEADLLATTTPSELIDPSVELYCGRARRYGQGRSICEEGFDIHIVARLVSRLVVHGHWHWVPGSPGSSSYAGTSGRMDNSRQRADIEPQTDKESSEGHGRKIMGI